MKILSIVVLFLSVPLILNAQTEDDKRLEELMQLQKELDGIDSKNEEKKRKEENEKLKQEKIYAAIADLNELNNKYLLALRASNFDELDEIIIDIKKHLVVEEVKCSDAAKLAIVNISDYYGIKDYKEGIDELVELLSDECDGKVKDYVLLSYYNSVGKIELAANIIEAMNLAKLPNSCYQENTSDAQRADCYFETLNDIDKSIATGLYINMALVKNASDNWEEAKNYAKAGITIAQVLHLKESEFAATLVLATFYFSRNELDKIYKLLSPFEPSIADFLPMYQKEYYRLMSAIASNKGDEEEILSNQNKMKGISADLEGAAMLIDELEIAYRDFEMQQGLHFVNKDLYDKTNLETLVQRMESNGQQNSPYYVKAILFLYVRFETSMWSMKDSKAFLLEKAKGIENERYLAQIYFTLAQEYYAELDDAAFEYLLLTKEIADKYHLKVLEFQCTQMLAFLYDMYEVREEAIPYYKEALQQAISFIDEYYPYLTEKEQFNFNQKWIIPLERSVFSIFPNLKLDQQNQLMYDLIEFRFRTKGLLLETSSKVKIAISNSTDENLLAQYDELIKLKQELSMKHQELDWQQKNDLTTKIESLEESIQGKLGITFKKKNQDLSISSIQNSLKAGEHAVEIVRSLVGTDEYLTDTVNYFYFIIPHQGDVSLVTKRNSEAMEGRSFNVYLKSIRFKLDDERSYDTYWSFIQDEIGDDNDILYVSIDGVYNGVSLAGLYNPTSKKYLYEEQSIIQLSSLRDLQDLDEKDRIVENKNVFVGRPKYFMNDNGQTNTERGGGISDLPGTEIEIESIASMLATRSMSFEKLLGTNANEELLKNVSSPSILHIATHGYFERNKDPEEMLDDPMLSSGLLLSGAGDEEDLNGQDGILTAYEISSINLTHTDLVVLSACESGLGEVRDGQGVYGLSRAFLVAGADAVISSLWKVNDTATQKFMEFFYSSWLDRHDITDALDHARTEVRKEYKDPYYWAAFVATVQTR